MRLFNFIEEVIEKYSQLLSPFKIFEELAALDRSKIGNRNSFKRSLDIFRSFAKVKQFTTYILK